MMREAPEARVVPSCPELARVGSDSNFWVVTTKMVGDTVIQLEACFWHIFPYMNG